MVEYYCQKCHFVNNRSVLFFNYCQKRCFVKIKNIFAPNSPQKFFKVILFYHEIKIKKPYFTGFLS